MPPLPQLLCLPPAGTGPSLYYPWTLRHKGRIDVHAVSLPGRETRIAEPLPDTIDELADRIADELAPRTRHRYAMFGYSMGAVLAYETARRWRAAGLPAPEAFFILGCNPPNRLLENRDPLHKLESHAFWRAIADLGGTPQEILDNTEALRLFEPMVRNDFRICETYESSARPERLDCAAHVFIADGDALVDAESAVEWQNFLKGGITLHSLSGLHILEKDAFDALLDQIVMLWDERRGGSGVVTPSRCIANVSQQGTRDPLLPRLDGG